MASTGTNDSSEMVSECLTVDMVLIQGDFVPQLDKAVLEGCQIVLAFAADSVL